MGNWNSTLLVPQHHLPSVINTRFVRRRRATLALHDGFWMHQLDHPLELRDLYTHIVLFGVDTSALSSRQLLDTYNLPVVSLEAPRCGSHPNVYSVTSIAKRTSTTTPRHAIVCRIRVTPSNLEMARVQVVDPNTKDRVIFTCEGDWLRRQALFFVDRNGQRECIAQMYRPEPTDEEMEIPTDCYVLDVASGVDLALLVLMCAALEEETGRRMEKSAPVAAVNEAVNESTLLSKYCAQASNMLFARRDKQDSNRVAVPA